MPDGESQLIWVRDTRGNLRGLHASCAEWLGLKADETDRQMYHTEICLGCGRFLDAVPPPHEGAPPFDPKSLL